MSNLKDQLIRLGSTNPRLRPHIRAILANEYVTLTDPWLLFLETVVDKVRGASHYKEYPVHSGLRSADIYVDGTPVFVEWSPREGFKRVDFSIEVPLGRDVDKAVRNFDKMLRTDFDVLIEKYGT